MKAIVVDLELNQPSNKIIQIGAVICDIHSHQILDTFSIICNPEGEMPSEFITTLTGITIEMVENGVPLVDGLKQFWDWIADSGAGKMLVQWGEGDMRLLEQQSNERNVKVPRLNTMNLKAVSSIMRQHKGSKAKGGLKNTMDLYGVPFYGDAHDGLIDSLNTAFLLFRLEEMWKFASDVEKSHGNIKVRGYEEAIKQFETIRKKKSVEKFIEAEKKHNDPAYWDALVKASFEDKTEEN
jgi:inhibitor of KinA sporulation pathway (predicted exonuclease)